MNNQIHDAMGIVHAEESLKQSTKAFIASKTSAHTKATHSRRMAAAFACFALLLLGFGGWRFYMTPVSTISVDVNPSLELGVNRFDRVVSVEGYNDDGTALAASVSLTNLSYSDALDVLLSCDGMRQYRESNGLISITVIGNTEQKSEEMQAKISSCSYAASPNVECQRGNSEDVTAAHEAGLSFGKYRAYLELQALDPTISTEDVQGLTMRQIRDWINKLSAGSGTAKQENGDESGGRQYHGGNQPLQ